MQFRNAIINLDHSFGKRSETAGKIFSASGIADKSLTIMEKTTLEMVTLLVLSSVGWLIANYYFRVHRGYIEARVWWMLPLFQMINCRCDEIADSYFGKTWGRSNAYWGMWYYALFNLLIIFYWQFNLPPLSIIFIMGLLAFAQSVYLSWGLFILRVSCRPCLGTHAINGIIFIVLLYHTYPLLVSQ